MVKTSAGLLMYKFVKPSSLTTGNKEKGKLLVFLVHPGGPFWSHKDKGVWGIPKGEQDDSSHDLFDVAKREFCEETSIIIPDKAQFISLGSIKQKNKKIVHAWAYENKFEFEFKCTSFVEHKGLKFPEVDKGEFFSIEEAKKKMLTSQYELVVRLMKELNMTKTSDKQEKLEI